MKNKDLKDINQIAEKMLRILNNSGYPDIRGLNLDGLVFVAKGKNKETGNITYFLGNDTPFLVKTMAVAMFSMAESLYTNTPITRRSIIRIINKHLKSDTIKQRRKEGMKILKEKENEKGFPKEV